MLRSGQCWRATRTGTGGASTWPCAHGLPLFFPLPLYPCKRFGDVLMDDALLLFHFTPARNKKQIERRGLLPSMSKGKKHRVWLVAFSQLSWGFEHVRRHHDNAKLVLFGVLIPFSCLIPVRPGVFTTYLHIGAASLRFMPKATAILADLEKSLSVME